MKCAHRSGLLALAAIATALVTSCGSGPGQPSSPDVTQKNSVSQAVSISITNKPMSGSAVLLAGGEAYRFTATVLGSGNTAVTWSIAECTAGCGSISESGNYTAPTVVAGQKNVKVVATSQADSTKSDSVLVRHIPVAVAVSPKTAWLRPGESLKFAATVERDISKAGVNWALECADESCGTLSDINPDSVTFKAPAEFSVAIALKASSKSDPTKVVQASINRSGESTLVPGDYAFLFGGWQTYFSGGYYSPHRIKIAGHFTADGNGNMLNGVEDISSFTDSAGGDPPRTVPFTGTYGVGPDRRGSFTIVSTEGSSTYSFVLDPSGKKARFIAYDGLPITAPVLGAGYLELQDKTAFSLSALEGNFAMSLSGLSDSNGRRGASVGNFTVSAAGVLASGKMDRVRQLVPPKQEYLEGFMLSGAFAAPSETTGRGTLQVGVADGKGESYTIHLAYYVVSAEKILLIQIDPRYAGTSILSGEARRQHGPFSAASLKGASIFSMDGLSRDGYGAFFEHVALGRFDADGSKSLTGTIDASGYPGLNNQAFYGDYSVAPDGRAVLALKTGDVDGAVGYFFNQNEAFLMQTTPGGDGLIGRIRPQSSGSFDPSSIQGTFLMVTIEPTSEESEAQCGLTTFDGVSGASTIFDGDMNLNDDPQKWLSHFESKGTYTLDANGRGTVLFPAQIRNLIQEMPARNIVFWLVSPTEIVASADMPWSDWTALVEYWR